MVMGAKREGSCLEIRSSNSPVLGMERQRERGWSGDLWAVAPEVVKTSRVWGALMQTGSSAAEEEDEEDWLERQVPRMGLPKSSFRVKDCVSERSRG